jgi:hypothetical protein
MDLDYPPPLDELLTMGRASTAVETFEYVELLGLTDAHVPELIRMATDPALNECGSDTDEVWAPLHAWRALAELRAETAVEPLLHLLHRYPHDDWVASDLPRALARIGTAAYEPLLRYLDDPERDVRARLHAGTALVGLAQAHPELRAGAVEKLAACLADPRSTDPLDNGMWVALLLDLDGVEALPVLERAFAEDRVGIWVAGDWEDVQVELGVLPARLTPRPP